MASELRLINRHVLYANYSLVFLELNNTIHQQKWVSMRKVFLYFNDVHDESLVVDTTDLIPDALNV